jgi:hypothetical protein
MKPRYYSIIENCIESGAERGLARARKHIDTPSDESIVENITREIMNELCEFFSFED